jgi:hypothetical protein
MERSHRWPAPDPSKRVEPKFSPATSSNTGLRRHGNTLIAAAGLGAIAISLCAWSANLFDLPSSSVVAIAALGVVLMVVGLVGVVKQRRSTAGPVVAAVGVERASVAIDLPSMTGQISGVLARLRREYGMAYRTRTWIEEMLPAYGADLDDPALARDLLGAAALDAGGIRADVSGLAESHTRDEIVATGCAILGALQNVLAACEVPTNMLPTPHASDPSSWPASKC